MAGWTCTRVVLVAAAVLVCGAGVSEAVSARWERECVDYFSTGTSYDWDELPPQMFGVYFWPPNQRQRPSCQHMTFTRLSQAELMAAAYECQRLQLPADETVLRASYTNSTGKPVSLLFYGRDEVKQMYRACNKTISKYLLIKVNDTYLLGINCSAGGRGVLLARQLPTAADLQAIVDSIDIMSGRDGRPDCPLRT